VAAEFGVLLVRGRPEPRAVPDDGAAGRIDGGQRRNNEAAIDRCRCRADAALEIDRGGAEPGADAAESEVSARCLRRRKAKVAIGRVAAPFLVAAIEEIEQNRPGTSGTRAVPTS